MIDQSDQSPWCPECGFKQWRGRCGRDRCGRNSGRWIKRQARRVKVNLASCTGELLMFTITGPGGDLTDFDIWAWNVDAWRRFAILRDHAGKQARREVPGVTTRLVAWVPELQARGMLHFHLVFEASTLLEKRWAERYCRYLRTHVVEHGFGPQTAKGQWGREDVGRYVSKLANYLVKESALCDLWEAGDAPGRCFYVSRRLSSKTGCTIRRLRVSARLWASERVSVPMAVYGDWAEYERELGRWLSRDELVCIGGVVQDRGPPTLSAAVGGVSAR